MECLISKQAFPRASRLTKASEYRRVYRSKHRGRSGGLAWQAAPNGLEYPRLGLAIPKRLVKRSVDRSRIKRMLRESFRKGRFELPPIDVVVSVKAVITDARDPGLAESVDELWHQITTRRR